MADLKYAGFDAVIAEGKADKPVYISIVDGQAAIKRRISPVGQFQEETQEIYPRYIKHARARVGVILAGR